MTWAWWLLVVAWMPTFYLIALSLAAWRAPNPWPPLLLNASPRIRFRIVIPAHNEARQIAAIARHALALDYPRPLFQVVVVANACTDETASLAAAAGAQVIEYAIPGKGGALDYAFGTLAADPAWDAVVVLDADSTLDRHALQVLDALFQAGAEAAQLRYAVANATAHPRTEIAAVQLASLNGLRPLARDRLGWSAGIYGNGFALARATLAAVPYRAFGIVEDLEYHQHLFLAGMRVRFADAATVWAEMPVARHQLATQRARWERGKLWTIRHYLGPVLRHFRHRPWTTLGQIGDLCMPPAAWVALLFGAALLLGPAWPARALALLGFLAIILHYLQAVSRYHLLALFGSALRHAPSYIAEKLWAVLHSAVTERHLGWKRTERE
jgi:cellulose synthase/poly-beta-1,6-N-acetylglucosamine synthase-like glycosyltransferase